MGSKIMYQVSGKKVDSIENQMMGLEAQDQKKIFWIEQRLDVSRLEALRIFKNSLL